MPAIRPDALPSKPEAEDLRPGEIVAQGRYRVDGLLGHGGMATVYRATDVQAGRVVALKVIAQHYVGRIDREKRFENEGRLAARLAGHRNIVAPLDAGRMPEHGGRMYIAMELAPGPTLLDLLNMHGPIPAAEACGYMRDVARAIRDLHASAVVHRDVKPQNVIVVQTPSGPVAKLVDFGLAADVGVAADRERLTLVDERPGTHHYMSPEQAWGAAAHPIFDMYALGCTFFELLVGEPPWHELGTGEVMQRKSDLTQPSASIRGRRYDLPPALEDLVDRCLAGRAGDRVPDAEAFLGALDAIMATLGFVASRAPQATAVLGQARTAGGTDYKPEPRLKRLLAEAAHARALGIPIPAALVPIRTGSTQPLPAAAAAPTSPRVSGLAWGKTLALAMLVALGLVALVVGAWWAFSLRGR